MVWNLEHFRPFLLGHEAIVYIDQRVVVWLLKQGYPSRYFRLVERILPYDATISYLAGKLNKVADFLSRYAFGAAPDDQLQNDKDLITFKGSVDLLKEIREMMNLNANGRCWNRYVLIMWIFFPLTPLKRVVLISCKS